MIDDMKVIDDFEKAVADFSNCDYGIAVSCCTNAIFLSLQYLKHIEEIKDNDIICIPCNTWVSVPCIIIHCDLKLQFKYIEWSGVYQLNPTRVWDCATRFMKDMYVGGNSLHCVSFQYKKTLKIGRGGMILTNDKDAMIWLKKARYHGKNLKTNKLDFIGWNMYMLPCDASRGLSLLRILPQIDTDSASYKDYPDISKEKIFKNKIPCQRVIR